jgi:hypothetical protein
MRLPKLSTVCLLCLVIAPSPAFASSKGSAYLDFGVVAILGLVAGIASGAMTGKRALGAACVGFALSFIYLFNVIEQPFGRYLILGSLFLTGVILPVPFLMGFALGGFFAKSRESADAKLGNDT